MDETTFDIFEFLKLSRREDVLHTLMIAGLLDPLGLHGLGDLFLGRFLERLSCAELPLKRTDALDYEWLIKQEHSFADGHIDILLLCREKRIAIAIENKIRSKESQDTPKRGAQLPRYLEWLRTLSPYFTNVRPYLLSLKGTAAVGLPPHECSAISYETILQCLLTCFEKTQRVPADLRSYARTLANLLKVEQPLWTRLSEPAEETFNIFHFLGITRRERGKQYRILKKAALTLFCGVRSKGPCCHRRTKSTPEKGRTSCTATVNG